MLKQLDVLIGFVVVMSVVSLLITIITQMISAALGLRGRNLADALAAMMHKIDPQIGGTVKDLAQQLADKVLTRPIISDSMLSMSKKWPVMWKRASAIRPDELLEVLKDIAGATVAPAAAPANVEEAAAGLLKKTGSPNSGSHRRCQRDQGRIARTGEETRSGAVSRIGNCDEHSAGQSRQVVQLCPGSRPAMVCDAHAVLDSDRLGGGISVAIGHLSPAGTNQQRPGVAFKTGREFGSSEKQAEEILNEAVLSSPESIGQEAVKQLKAKDAKMARRLPAGMDTAAKASEWLQTHSKKDKDTDAVKKYWEMTQTVPQEKLDRSAKQFATLTDELSKSKFQFVPDPYRWENCWPVHLHFWGILVSAALLSLGAPFWFNTLKSLTNLRSMLAKEVDKDPKQRPKTLVAEGK